jgi:hypothetical protein
MGMDVYGLNPKQNEINEEDFKVYLKYANMEFEDKWKALDKDEKLKKKYWEQQEEYEHVNPGNYFRNNCWWWRPLWDYVCRHCDDILTEEDMNGCTDNSGYQIDADKALRIGIRLHAHIFDGTAEAWEKGYNKELDEIKKEDEKDWRLHYPFHTKNVKAFAEFCVESGGFEVC